jgi:hypothetical protein
VNIGVEYLETTCLGPILSGDIQQLVLQELPRKLTAALFKRCGSYNKGTNVDTEQWSASLLWQEGYGVHLQELPRKMDLTWWSRGKDISVNQRKPLRFLSVGLHEVLSLS